MLSLFDSLVRAYFSACIDFIVVLLYRVEVTVTAIFHVLFDQEVCINCTEVATFKKYIS